MRDKTDGGIISVIVGVAAIALPVPLPALICSVALSPLDAVILPTEAESTTPAPSLVDGGAGECVAVDGATV